MSGAFSPRVFKKIYRCLRLILRHSGGTSSQFKKESLHSQTQFYLGWMEGKGVGYETLVCVDYLLVFVVVVVCFWLAEVASAWINLGTQSCSITEEPIFRIPLQILKRASLS